MSPTSLFINPTTGEELSLDNILAGYTPPKRPKHHPATSPWGSWREWNAYEKELKDTKAEFLKSSKEFDALKGLGSIFSSGLKLRKTDKKFATGQSSLFIQ